MRYRKLGLANLHISEISFGESRFGSLPIDASEYDKDEAIRIVKQEVLIG